MQEQCKKCHKKTTSLGKKKQRQRLLPKKYAICCLMYDHFASISYISLVETVQKCCDGANKLGPLIFPRNVVYLTNNNICQRFDNTKSL